MSRRVSCVDIGTNTALLLIADLDPATGTIQPVYHKQTIVRLGKNVDAAKTIDPQGMQRLVDCMTDYRQLSDEHAAKTIIAAGTSALRDAKNRAEVIEAVERASGITIECISGKEEADLTFSGAVAGMSDIPELFTVIDIGGGSTEISMGSPGAITESVSLDIGSVRLTERFFTTLPRRQVKLRLPKAASTSSLRQTSFPFLPPESTSMALLAPSLPSPRLIRG